MITKAGCGEKVFSAMTKRNLVELSSGQGQDFCDAIGEAIYNIFAEDFGPDWMTHTHECTAPGSPTVVPIAPIVSVEG